MGVVKNSDTLATTPLRTDALAILEAGYAAVQTKGVIERSVTREDTVLHIGGKTFDLESFERVFVVGIGKCALDACQELENVLGGYVTGGIVLDVRGGVLKKLTGEVGTHPLPSEKNMAVAQSIADLLEGATERDLVLTVISGGGSALLCLPNDLSCEDMTAVTNALMDKGATIAEINTVRKHTSRIQGGQFAKRAYPARVVSLIFSDVPGDDMGVIASGPTVRDTTTVADAEAVLAKYGTLALCKLDGCNLIETPKEEKYFEKVTNVLVLSNRTALVAMAETARMLGYRSEIITTNLEGEAERIGAFLAMEATVPKMCKLYGGETTVTVRNPRGKGGRNQELALGALASLPEDTLLVAVASDGWDNSDVAGALVDTVVVREAKRQGLEPAVFRDVDTTYDFFQQAGGHIVTGRLGSNVSDLYFTLHA